MNTINYTGKKKFNIYRNMSTKHEYKNTQMQVSPNVHPLPTRHLLVYSTDTFPSFPRLLVESLLLYLLAKKRPHFSIQPLPSDFLD